MAAFPADLVIFDCDGVLVDSEPISISVLCKVLAGSGLAIDEDFAYERFLGRSMAAIAEDIDAEFGLVITPGHLDSIRHSLYERFERELKPIAGVIESLDNIGRRFCVASSSQPERIRLSLRITGLLERFEPNIYSATMVANSKPAPDLFLLAARSMGVEPSRCVVVEDSPAGIAAARSAGMRVFAFTGGAHARAGRLAEKARTLGPDLIFDDMRTLPALLENGSGS